MNRLTSIAVALMLLLAFAIPVSASTVQVIPTFSIISAVTDQSVTIETANFPANDTFTVTMGAFGTRGVGGVVVGTTDSGNGGSFQATYKIPSSLAGSERIAIRLQSPTSGFFAFNWFWNNPTTTSSTATPMPGASSFPTIFITSVVKDQSVTILTNNLPPNDTFSVTMGKMGTKGVDGIVVGSTPSGSKGGALTETYTIPSSLVGHSQIAIRLQSPTSGFFAFNWFFNTTASVTPPSSTPSATPSPTPSASPTSTPSGSTTFPTFSIVAVVKDQTVTIKGMDFPANDTFDVLMGAFGTQGIDGINVDSTNTGSGGSLTATYDIPASLAGSEQIAIRLQSPTSGFFAFNWFFNNTTTP